MLKTALTCATMLVLCTGAYGSEITFEDRPAGPTNFAAAGPAQALVYNIGGITATFTGGVILTNETSQTTDFSNVYATASFGSSTLTNPLLVTFSQPIHNFQIDILNAIAGNYTLSDDAGNTKNFSLATTGSSLVTEGFAAAGDKVMINFDGPPYYSTAFDFAIDNVTFDQPLGTPTVTPEPGTLYLLGTGVVTAFYSFRRKLRPSPASESIC